MRPFIDRLSQPMILPVTEFDNITLNMIISVNSSMSLPYIMWSGCPRQIAI